jgi:starvation-inducible DNA-binding protein
MKFRVFLISAIALFYLFSVQGQEQEEVNTLNTALAQEVRAITELAIAQTEQQQNASQEAIDIGLTSAQKKLGRGLLHEILSTEFVIYSKTLNFHWNVTGPLFSQLHGFFKELYEEQFKAIDLLAERIRALGWPVNASLTSYLKHSKVIDQTILITNEKVMLAGLLQDYQQSIKYYREAIAAFDKAGDAGTSNFLQELLVQHEHRAWMLRAYITEQR